MHRDHNGDDMQTLTFRIASRDLARLRQLADSQDRSIAAALRVLIRRAVNGEVNLGDAQRPEIRS